jgi:hypothetical protein
VPALKGNLLLPLHADCASLCLLQPAYLIKQIIQFNVLPAAAASRRSQLLLYFLIAVHALLESNAAFGAANFVSTRQEYDTARVFIAQFAHGPDLAHF